MAHPMFKYNRLPDSKTHIRLIKIRRQQGDQRNIVDDRIQCTVITLPLSQARLRYTAISYTWGDQESKPTIFLQHEDHQVLSIKHVTKNVNEILLRFQKDRTETLEPEINLWIDQICIQQADDIEKSDQVNLMTDIYGNAKQVVVWLGPSDDDSGDAVRYLKDISQDLSAIYGFNANIHMATDISQLVNQKIKLWPGKASEQHKFIQHVQKRVDETPTQAVIRLFDRTWFTRVWTIQEACLGENTVFYCGDDVFSADTLQDALLSFIWLLQAMGFLYNTTNESIRIDNEKLSRFQSIDISRITQIVRLRQRIKRQKRNEVDPLDDESIMELVRRLNTSSDTSRLNASDPRDRIYGLLGLAKQEGRLKVDYQKSVEQVYTEFAAQVLCDGEIDILAFSQFSKLPSFNSQPSRSPKLPSWVPDWASRIPIVPPYGLSPAFKPYFSAGGTLQGAEVEFKEPDTLFIHGVRLDTIVTSSKKPYCPPSKAAVDIDSIALHFAEIWSFCSDKGSKYENPAAVAWRIAIGGLVLGRVVFSRRATLDDYEQFSKLFESIRMSAAGIPVPQNLAQNEATGLYLASMHRMSGRKTFRTQNGYVGLGPAGLMDDDVIVVFYGGSLPYILRRNKEAFEYVGEAYCEGVMDGVPLHTGVKEKFCIL